MRLIHYSPEPITFDPGRQYNGAGYAKPAGFWVSVDGAQSWKDWCEGEGWRLEALACAHLVTLKDRAKVLRIDRRERFDAFEERYCELMPHSGREAQPNWVAVARNYAGIIIAPYRWDRRLERLWYYGWDCASGVIWDLDAIDSVTLLSQEDVLSSPGDTEDSA